MNIVDGIKQKKNIVIVLPSLAREGGIILAYNISSYLIEKGFGVIIIYLNLNRLEMLNEFNSLEARIITVDLKNGFLRYFKLIFSIYNICNRYKPEALLSILFGWHLFIAVGAKLALVKKIIVHVGNLAPYWEPSFWKFKLLVRLAEPLTDKLICCSEFIRETTVKHYGVSTNHTSMIYNSVDPVFADCYSKKDPKKKKDFNIGVIGRLDDNRDYETLIESISLLHKKKFPIHFTIVGDGVAFKVLERKIQVLHLEEITTMTGTQSNIPKVLEKFDIFAWPALYREGFGIALIEAICAGIPSVVTDTPSNRELLNEKYAEFVSPLDSCSMAQGLINVMDNYEMSIDKAKIIRSEIIEKYSFEKMINKYVEEMKLKS